MAKVNRMHRVLAFLGLAFVLAAGAEPAPRLSFDRQSVRIDGRRAFLVSGEFHYFRVPKADWKRRMELFKAAGGNCLATYVPWIVHEPEEGRILFGDRPERDLAAFLRLAQEEGLMVIVRPGPYQYSELVNAGLPNWLLEKYPEIRLRQADGSPVAKDTVDYLHPTFLSHVRTYFKAVAEVIRPYLAVHGGPIVLTQLDNEMTGIHIWQGYRPDAAYFVRCAHYLETLKGYLAEDGIVGPYCHNSGCAAMTATYKASVDRLGTRDFLLGYDHYYGLQQSESESPNPYYFINALFACDMLRGFGYPPIGFEIQCGTIGDVPVILKEDLLACWMVNLAAGLKGINYYVFTGGPNFPGTAQMPEMEIYDYQAPVGPAGEVRPTYGALKAFGGFLSAHPELLDAERLTSVRVGLEWEHTAHLAPFDEGFNRYGMFYALLQTPYSPEFFLLDKEIPCDGKPLVLAGVSAMSEEAQVRVADYVRKGGKLLVAPDFPRVDLFGRPCTLLADAASAATVLKETWKTQFFRQSERVATALEGLGARPVIRSSNRNVFTTTYRLVSGKVGVFALNLRPGEQETTLTLPDGRESRMKIPPMTVDFRIF